MVGKNTQEAFIDEEYESLQDPDFRKEEYRQWVVSTLRVFCGVANFQRSRAMEQVDEKEEEDEETSQNEEEDSNEDSVVNMPDLDSMTYNQMISYASHIQIGAENLLTTSPSRKKDILKAHILDSQSMCVGTTK